MKKRPFAGGDEESSFFVDQLIKRMTLEQKVGQCFVIGFVNSVLTPAILRRIRTLYPAGVRVGLNFRAKTAVHDPVATSRQFAERVIREPNGTVKDYIVGQPVPHVTNEEYCAFLNRLKSEALNNGLGHPLHITFDMEGDTSADYCRGGAHTFPSCMGLARTGNRRLCYDVAWSVARQVRPVGIGWIHSPVLDVNTSPDNPEIGTRAYGEDPETVAEYALEGLRGLRDGGLVATGKHFPGRGHSEEDAHDKLPVIDLSREEMETHLAPYRALIAEGLPAIMSAHTAYPALDPSGLPASLSKPILTDLLKGEMGFEGVITTDDITMGGVVEKFEVADACVTALNAGNDLILLRDESPLIDEVIPEVVEAARAGRLPEERLNDALRRSLSVKYEYGFFADGAMRDVAHASDGIRDSRVCETARLAARSGVSVFRDREGLLPLDGSKRVLLIEQANPLHRLTNTQRCHPGILWEQMLRHSESVGMVETEMPFSEDDRRRVRARLGEADVIVTTNYYYRNQKCGNGFVEELAGLGKPLVVITNTPYPFTVRPEYGTVVFTFGVSPESMEALAGTLFGRG